MPMSWLAQELLVRGWATESEESLECGLPPASEQESAEPVLLQDTAIGISSPYFAMPDGDVHPLQAETGELDHLLAETSKHLRNIGRVNILVAGQTGVGKSTLINSVFGENFAATAAGKPVTQYAEWFSSDAIPLRILDTKGLEAEDYESTLLEMRAEIERCRLEKDAGDQLHIGWVCIATPSSRVQSCEINIVRLLNKYDIPAIIVLTKDDEDPDFPGIVAKVMEERHAKYAAIVPVRALSRRSTPAYGLEELVTGTYKVLPQAHRAAFAAAQKVNRDLTRAAAGDYVVAAATAAAAASAIPLPFADIATLVPIQAGMLVGISSAFNLSLDSQQLTQLVTTTMGSLAASLAGRWVIGSALKFIPGPGTVLGSVLNAALAGGITRTMGRTYIKFLYEFLETNGRVPNGDEILAIFPAFFKAER